MQWLRLGPLKTGDSKKEDDSSRKGGPDDKVEGHDGSSQQGASPAVENETQSRERDDHKKKKKPKGISSALEEKASQIKHADDSETGGSHQLGQLAGVPDISRGAASASSGGTGLQQIRQSDSIRQSGAGLSVNDFISKSKEKQRQGLKPSGPELIAYARYLGIDPVADHDLLWIAVEALEAPLPSDWTEHFDSNDRVFYYNATMRVSSWTHPLEHIYRETYKTIVNFRNSNTAPQERQEKLKTLSDEVSQMEDDVKREIAQWSEHKDEQGNRFYFNREERQSTWTDPRPAKCQILHLKMKMVTLLSGEAKASESIRALQSFKSPEFEENAFKRPKAVGTRNIAEGTESAHTALERPDSSHSTHGELELEEKKHKKKDKKDKKRRGKDDADQSAPQAPPRLGQSLRNSQSEPTVGNKTTTLLGNMDEARGGHGGLQSSVSHQPSGPHSPGLSSFDHNDTGGLSTVGRARPKAGIRLDPIKNPDNPPAGLGTATTGEFGVPGAGVRNSASVPALQP
jgi:hypothetical protein